MTWDKTYREAARIIDETFGQTRRGRPMINSPLTPAQLEEMRVEASDPKWRRAPGVRYCCWVCHKSMSAAEATEVTLWSGSKVYYCAKDYAERDETLRSRTGAVSNHNGSPDSALRTRARVLTDEGSIEDSSEPLGMGPEPFTAARLETLVHEADRYAQRTRCVDCGGGFDETGRWSVGERRGWLCQDCHKRHVEARTPKAASPPPVPVAEPPEPRAIVYCSSAPPRELVESHIVRCGTGLIGGAPVMAPMVWAWKMRREWERHVEFAPKGYIQAEHNQGRDHLFYPGVVTDDRDVDIPRERIGVDQFGGEPFTGLRCRLCGGWLRRKVVP